MLLIISGPSGAGKSTLCSWLLRSDASFSLSVSYTTRPPRGDEMPGVAYHFVTQETFTQMVGSGAFAEYAQVHGNGYGTSRQVIDDALAEGRSLLFDIDVQGAAQLRDAYPGAVTVMMLPPDLASLEARLRGRGTDSEAVIARRMRAAIHEISHAPRFDYVVLNDEVASARARLAAIVEASRCRSREVLMLHGSIWGISVS